MVAFVGQEVVDEVIHFLGADGCGGDGEVWRDGGAEGVDVE